MKTRVIISILILAVVARVWLRFSMSNLSDRIDRVTADYHNLEARLDQHKAFRDSLDSNYGFRTKVLDSGSVIALEQLEEIKKTIQQKHVIFSDKETLTRRLKIYESLNNLTYGLILIGLLILIFGLLKRR